MEPEEKTSVEYKKLNEYISTAKAAEILGIDRGTLVKWSDKKKIPVYYNPMNNYRMYKPEDLQKILEQTQIEDYKRFVKKINKRYLTPKPKDNV